jgi:AraC-like DNA-binding protein
MIASGAETQRDVRWSTDSLASPDPVAGWAELLSKNIAEMHVETPSRHGYRAIWDRIGLGPVDLNFLQASPQRVKRTRAMVQRQRAADYDLLYMQKGPASLVHCGERLLVSEGSFVLLDNLEAYDLTFSDESTCLTTHLDDRWLRKWIAHPRLLAAKPIRGDHEWAAPLAATLRTIAAGGLHGAALPRSIIADQFGALLALMAGQGERQNSRHHADLFLRLKRALQERFDECALDPASLACEIGISKRHLHGIFAQAGTTFGGVLLDIRLKHAAQLLSDRRFSSYRVGDVAWACGFADPSHFARRFRLKFGASPLKFREEALGA